MRRFRLSLYFSLALSGLVLSGSNAGAQPVCNPVASWTNEFAAVCIKYLCPGFEIRVRCLRPPALRCTGPRGRNPCM
jgi:hypothetical protein